MNRLVSKYNLKDFPAIKNEEVRFCNLCEPKFANSLKQRKTRRIIEAILTIIFMVVALYFAFFKKIIDQSDEEQVEND